jgi:hypothetical protein
MASSFPSYLEGASSLRNDVELILLVRLLAVGLRSHEDVDPGFEARRSVDDLVASIAHDEPFLHPLDVELVRALSHAASQLTVCRAVSGLESAERPA